MTRWMRKRMRKGIGEETWAYRALWLSQTHMAELCSLQDCFFLCYSGSAFTIIFDLSSPPPLFSSFFSLDWFPPVLFCLALSCRSPKAKPTVRWLLGEVPLTQSPLRARWIQNPINQSDRGGAKQRIIMCSAGRCCLATKWDQGHQKSVTQSLKWNIMFLNISIILGWLSVTDTKRLRLSTYKEKTLVWTHSLRVQSISTEKSWQRLSRQVSSLHVLYRVRP